LDGHATRTTLTPSAIAMDAAAVSSLLATAL
jgi:hypothetical protein